MNEMTDREIITLVAQMATRMMCGEDRVGIGRAVKQAFQILDYAEKELKKRKEQSTC
jgi:hypothetical protein